MAADVSGLRAKALQRYDTLAREAGSALQAELRVRSPHKTYELRNSVKVTVTRSGATSWLLTAVAPVIQAITTNTGARPHLIRPRRAKMLRFDWPKVGHVVFTTLVHHPGNKGTHWWDKVLERRTSIFGRVLARL